VTDIFPLAGVRVLDFSRLLAGPFCTAMLADLGAEVIKVESREGDDYRHIGPFVNGESALFALVNRGKRSVVLDLKTPEGQRAARALAIKSDVVVENFRPGVADRLGVGYAELARGHPKLVYASISGFGQSGADGERPAYDVVAQAMSGLMSVTGAPDGPPMQVGEPIGDMAAGIYAAFGIVTALFACERHGVGRRLDVALTDSLVSLMMMAVAQHCYGGVRPRRVGNRHPISTPFGSFRAADGDIIIAVASNALFSRLAAALGRPELARNPRYGDDASRTRHEPELRAEIEAWTGARPVAEAVRALTAAGVPASPIAELPEVVTSTYVAARELFHRLVHPVMGPITLIEQPVHFAGLPRGRIGLPPALGADTETALRDIAGLDDSERARLGATSGGRA
jgi:CoA:oxalate CoA-transferase